VYTKQNFGKYVRVGICSRHVFAHICHSSKMFGKSTVDVCSIVFSQNFLSDSPASSGFNDKWNLGSNVWTCIVSSIRVYVQYPQQTDSQTPITSLYRYGASALAAAANSGSHLSPFARSFSLLYSNSSLVSVAYSALGDSTIASTGQLS